MAWRRPGDKPLSEPMLVNLLTHICVTQTQWVKTMLTKIHDPCGIIRPQCDISALQCMKVNKVFACCQPIRSHVWKFLLIKMDFNMEISLYSRLLLLHFFFPDLLYIGQRPSLFLWHIGQAQYTLYVVYCKRILVCTPCHQCFTVSLPCLHKAT